MTKLIKDWKELAKIHNESNTRILDVCSEYGGGWILPRNDITKYEDEFMERNSFCGHFYLCTHAFYEGLCEEYTKILQACGFDVELKLDDYNKEIDKNEIVKYINSYWVDENGNKWDYFKYSKEQAEEYSKSLIKCNNCVDCTYCENCENCINCTSCIKCRNCKACMYCEDCVSCTNCVKCKSCRFYLEMYENGIMQ